MKVICISGKARHGKDTSAEFMADALNSAGISTLISHYGDLVKYVCKTFCGWNGVKDEAGRSTLQYIGTDIIREQRPDYWVGFIADMLELIPDVADVVLIPDARFPNEIYTLRERGFDVTHVRIERPDFDTPLTREQQVHPSETALDDEIPDYILCNDGTLSDLKECVSTFVNDFIGGN